MTNVCFVSFNCRRGPENWWRHPKSTKSRWSDKNFLLRSIISFLKTKNDILNITRVSGGDKSVHHHEVTWIRKMNFRKTNFWSKTALKSGISWFRIEITGNKSHDFHTKIGSYSVTQSRDLRELNLGQKAFQRLIFDCCMIAVSTLMWKCLLK